MKKQKKRFLISELEKSGGIINNYACRKFSYHNQNNKGK